MSSPVVIQGTAVSSPAWTTPSHKASNTGAGTAATHIEEKRETKCNDPIFVVLFLANIAAIVAVAAIYGEEALTNTSSSSTETDYSAYVAGCVVMAVISFGFAALGVAVMMCIPETLIKVSLIFSVIMSLVATVMAWLSGQWGIAVMSTIFFALTLCYACAVWSRIPFAAINLVTATTAIKANLGVCFYALITTGLGVMWTFTWGLAFVGVFDKTYVCDANNVCSDPNYGYLFLLFVAFFFGQQVFQYSIHVVVAGTTASWWYTPDECGCCSSAVNGAFIRTFTTSLGSISFGSLIVAILQALRMVANAAQQDGDMQFLACIAECILACLASIVEYFNKWAFIYVGIYGFGYIRSGKEVMQLFANRGWEAIAADSLVGDTLFLVSLVVGLIIGCIAMLLQISLQLFTTGENENDLLTSFFLGFFIGLTICSIMLSLIGSGVNAVIVLFAEAPAEFQQNHPDLSNRMRQIWNEIYPGSV